MSCFSQFKFLKLFCVSLVFAQGISYAYRVPRPNIDFLLKDEDMIVLLGIVSEIKNIQKSNPDKGDLFEVTVDITHVLNGKYSYKQFKYVFATRWFGGNRHIEHLNKGQNLVLLPPRDQSDFMTFDTVDRFGMFIPNKILWFSKDNEKTQQILKALGFKYYSRKLALERALKYVSGVPFIVPSALDIRVESMKHIWKVTGRCKGWFGCPSEQSEFQLSFGKFGVGPIHFTSDLPKKAFWEKLKFWQVQNYI